MRFLEIAGSKQRGLNWDAVRDVKMQGVMVYDMTDLPMKGVDDQTYSGVYNEHFIEHLTKDEGINFLKEMLRVMRICEYKISVRKVYCGRMESTSTSGARKNLLTQ